MLNSKQIYNRINKCYESEYGYYDGEIEWYGTDVDRIWMFHIPSKKLDVRLMLNEANDITIEERGQGDMEYHLVGKWRA